MCPLGHALNLPREETRVEIYPSPKPLRGISTYFIGRKKAFDTVDHEILLSKSLCYGIRGLALDSIISHLTNRSEYVCYNNSNSELKNIQCGVPQGSILGPVLCFLYRNDT